MVLYGIIPYLTLFVCYWISTTYKMGECFSGDRVMSNGDLSIKDSEPGDLLASQLRYREKSSFCILCRGGLRNVEQFPLSKNTYIIYIHTYLSLFIYIQYYIYNVYIYILYMPDVSKLKFTMSIAEAP